MLMRNEQQALRTVERMKTMASRPHVLVVNDDIQMRQRIRKAIEGQCEVIAPETHQELLDALAAGPLTYDLVILDYEFTFWAPQRKPLNGGDVLEILRPDPTLDRPYVILLTNFVTNAEVQRLVQRYHVPVGQFREESAADIAAVVVAVLGLDR
jgi:CheY-like chemotaxis protein